MWSRDTFKELMRRQGLGFYIHFVYDKYSAFVKWQPNFQTELEFGFCISLALNKLSIGWEKSEFVFVIQVASKIWELITTYSYEPVVFFCACCEVLEWLVGVQMKWTHVQPLKLGGESNQSGVRVRFPFEGPSLAESLSLGVRTEPTNPLEIA